MRWENDLGHPDSRINQPYQETDLFNISGTHKIPNHHKFREIYTIFMQLAL